METFARSCVVHMGAEGMIALYSATVRQLKEAAILWHDHAGPRRLARRCATARRAEANPVDAVRQAVGGFLAVSAARSPMWTGVSKAVGTVATAKMAGAGDLQPVKRACCSIFRMSTWPVRIDGEFAATVPDLIAVLDSETGEPITTEALRYGMRVAVIAFSLRSGNGGRQPRWSWLIRVTLATMSIMCRSRSGLRGDVAAARVSGYGGGSTLLPPSSPRE